MKSRRKAREAALQLLYMCDTARNWDPQQIDIFFEAFVLSDEENSEVERKNTSFSRRLMRGVCENVEYLDSIINQASTRWSVRRMARVDRNIIRLATYELAFEDEIPTNVSINESIEIAKRFGTKDSPVFVNGVLDHVARLVKEGAATKSKQTIKKLAVS
ncbi:MAG: transcription antitermination factor NusB [Candidatus Dadabacteria bacterium]|nr:MAG: transcription antitermination factor NusB [Candidatus Dadabacteria bacterium]